MKYILAILIFVAIVAIFSFKQIQEKQNEKDIENAYNRGEEICCIDEDDWISSYKKNGDPFQKITVNGKIIFQSSLGDNPINQCSLMKNGKCNY
jgi:hypothetical protein